MKKLLISALIPVISIHCASSVMSSIRVAPRLLQVAAQHQASLGTLAALHPRIKLLDDAVEKNDKQTFLKGVKHACFEVDFPYDTKPLERLFDKVIVTWLQEYKAIRSRELDKVFYHLINLGAYPTKFGFKKLIEENQHDLVEALFDRNPTLFHDYHAKKLLNVLDPKSKMYRLIQTYQ
jgi:hypothetical protein